MPEESSTTAGGRLGPEWGSVDEELLACQDMGSVQPASIKALEGQKVTASQIAALGLQKILYVPELCMLSL